MGTATLKSIFVRTVDQMINIATTVNKPIHKNGETKTDFKKNSALAKSKTENQLAPRHFS